MQVDRMEFSGLIWSAYGNSGKFMIRGEIGRSILGHMEAHGSSHRVWSWKLQLMEAIEVSASTVRNVGNFHILP